MRIETGGTWYHGSDCVFDVLLQGSTVTPWRALAEAFSHKPTLLGYDDDGAITHNGTACGYLYVIDEPVEMGKDVYPHPRTTMTQNAEFLTARPLKVRLVCALGEGGGVMLAPYQAGDADVLSGFIISFWKTHHDDVTPQEAADMLNEWTQGEHKLFVIRRQSAPIGFLRTHNSSDTVCWIDDIYVDAPHRGQGVASAAIGLLEGMLRARGVESFCMEVVPDNLPALRLYHRLGYDRLSVVVMRKDTVPFDTARTETIAGLPMRVKQFND